MPDFTNIGANTTVSDFSNVAQSDLVTFVNTGDNGVLIVTTHIGFGEGGFGEGPFGGEITSFVLNPLTTVWTDIETP